MQAKIVVAENARTLSPEQLVELFFGKSLSELAREIKANPGGKYDALYKPVGKKNE